MARLGPTSAKSYLKRHPNAAVKQADGSIEIPEVLLLLKTGAVVAANPVAGVLRASKYDAKAGNGVLDTKRVVLSDVVPVDSLALNERIYTNMGDGTWMAATVTNSKRFSN